MITDRIELNSLLLPLLTVNHQIMSYKERFVNKSRIPTIVQQYCDNYDEGLFGVTTA